MGRGCGLFVSRLPFALVSLGHYIKLMRSASDFPPPPAIGYRHNTSMQLFPDYGAGTGPGLFILFIIVLTPELLRVQHLKR